MRKHHPYHITENNTIPAFLSGGMLLLILGLLRLFHKGEKGLMLIGLTITIYYLIQWSKLIMKESQNGNIHNKEIENQLMLGAILFIISETMLFFGFFWAYFHIALNPGIIMGNVFPPIGIEPLNPAHWPLINTLTLLLSGVFINGFYYTLKGLGSGGGRNLIRLIKRNQLKFKMNYTLGKDEILRTGLRTLQMNYKNLYKYLILTIGLGIIFLGFQVHEYINHASFEYADGMYGAIFYSLTGLHGLHILAGIVFLIFSYYQLKEGYYDKQMEPHIGMTFSILYFHYVDIVWLFLYVFVYLWGY